MASNLFISKISTVLHLFSVLCHPSSGHESQATSDELAARSFAQAGAKRTCSELVEGLVLPVPYLLREARPKAESKELFSYYLPPLPLLLQYREIFFYPKCSLSPTPHPSPVPLSPPSAAGREVFSFGAEGGSIRV